MEDRSQYEAVQAQRRLAYPILLRAVKDLVGRSQRKAESARDWLYEGGWLHYMEFSVQVLGLRPSILRNVADVLMSQRHSFAKRVKFNVEAVVKALIEAGDEDEQDGSLS